MVDQPPENNDTPVRAEVKEKQIPGTLQKFEYKIRLQGQMLYAVQEYASKRGLSVPVAIVEMMELRLVQQRYLPDWWWERIGKH